MPTWRRRRAWRRASGRSARCGHRSRHGRVNFRVAQIGAARLEVRFGFLNLRRDGVYLGFRHSRLGFGFLKRLLAHRVHGNQVLVPLEILLRQNRLGEALPAFRKASALDQTDTVSLCMIGYALERLGKPEQAIPYYSKALKLKPNDEMATKFMATVNLNE